MAELAEALGVDREGLERTVEEYHGFVDEGVDRRFDRPAATMVKIARGPFYGFRWGGVLINTLGGPRKDAGARVLDPDRKPIPGLYAAGEISATYTSVLEGGGSIGDVWAFGRIAGRNVAQEPDRTTQPTAAGALA
ncbi:MAG: fumarate reductase [Conexibacter sp.]|nr:fumarate reductase [Conexibacter sp.]